MPALGPALAAIFTVQTLVNTAIVVGLSLVSTFISKGLQKKPKLRDPGTSLDAEISPAPPRRVIYGERHVGGIRTFIQTTENPFEISDNQEIKNEMLHLVYTFTDHEIADFKAVFLGDYPVYKTHLVLADGTDIDGSASTDFFPIQEDTPAMAEMYTAVQGRYSQYVRDFRRDFVNGQQIGRAVWKVPFAADFSLGNESSTTQPFPWLNYLLPSEWGADAKQYGCSKIHFQLMHDINRFPNGLPNISAIVRGKKCKDPRDNSDFDLVTAKFTRNPAVIGLDFLLTPADDGGFGALETEVDLDSFESAANICDEFIDIDSPSHSGYSEVTCDQSAEVSTYPRVITVDPPDPSRQLGRHKNTILVTRTGTPIRMSSGDRVRVSLVAGGSLPSGLSAGTDYYVSVLEPWPAPTDRRRLLNDYYEDYGQPVHYSRGATQNVAYDQGRDKWFYPRIALHTTYADAVQESYATRVSLGTIGTGQFKIYKTGEPRYCCDYDYTVDETKRETLENIAATMAGDFIYSGGKWVCKAGAYEAPTVSLDEDHCVSSLSVQTAASARDTFNAVTGLYVLGYESKGELVTYPVVKSSVALAEDDDVEATAALDLPAVSRLNQAQRCAQIKLLDSRQGITWQQDFNWKAYQLRAGDFFYYSNDRMGWSNKAFRVMRWERLMSEDNGVPRIYFRIQAKETAAEVYEADPALLEAADPAPNTNLPDAFNVGEPENLTLTEFKRNPSGTIVEAVVQLSWDAPSDGFVERYEIQYKKTDTDDTTYDYLNGFTQRESVAEILNLEAPLSWSFRVRSVNHLGVSSEWVEIEQEITGLSDRPSDPAWLQVIPSGGMAQLTWPLATDLDVFFGGYVYIRHDSVNDPPDWPTALSIQPISVGGNETSATCPLIAGNYLIKFVDSSGNESVGFAFAYTDQTSSIAYTNEYQIRQNPTFSGVHYYTNVNGSNELTLNTSGGLVEPEGTYEYNLSAYSGTIDDRPGNVDDWADWDATGLVWLSGGGTRRITAVREVTIDNIATTVDSRTGLVDTWADWDNVSGSEADAWMEARICTETNPFLLTATWSDWFRVDSAELYYTGLGLREQLRSYDPQGQIEMQVVGADIDTPA